MGKKFYIETYGCQMNVADSEVVAAILTAKGFEHTKDKNEADILLCPRKCRATGTGTHTRVF